MKRCAKIVATIGPASEDEATLRRLMLAGMDVARLNFSHGTQEHHGEVYQRLRRVAERLDRPITILQDLQGPKMRTGAIEGGSVELTTGQPLTLTSRPLTGDTRLIPIDFPELAESVRPGSRVLLDDGNLELEVTGVSGSDVETRVVVGGVLKPRKGVNLPGAEIHIPGFTEKDREDLVFGMQLGVDAVAVSFVRTAKDIQEVRAAINCASTPCKPYAVIAKLERPEALENLEDIIEAADGVMVARGDLGVEMPPETVPIAQKRIIAAANQHARLVITATQMLDSMIRHPHPTRAEASDVANAIFDGTDAVMLSGETATGSYPVQAVEFMERIVCQAEGNMARWGHWDGVIPAEVNTDDTFFLTRAAGELAHDGNVAAIAVFTKTGRTALMMSKARPVVPILAFTPEPGVYQAANLYWRVFPHLVPHANTIDEMLASVDQTLLSSTRLEPGQQVVLICGYPVDQVRPTNLALLHTIGQ